MRRLNVEKIKETVSKLCVEANVSLRKDIENAIKHAIKSETNKRAKRVLEILIENANIARKEYRPLCQDTGLVSVYVEIGQNVKLIGGDLVKAIDGGVELGYRKSFLRKSVVKSPLLRKNTGTNTPSVIYTKIVKGNRVKITVSPKGFGSENKSKLQMLNPTASEEDVISFVVNTIKDIGPDACPPYILGIGIGGTFDKAASLAKEALLLPVNKRSKVKHLKAIENKILKKVNSLKIGAMGFGGKTTCLGVKVLEYPTHIAGLPLAINVGCHVTRSASKTI